MAMFYASLFSLFTIVVSCLLRFAFFKSKSAANINLPPGRRGWPVIGETVEFVTAGWKGHPEKFIVDRMKKFSHHVFRTSLMLEDAAVFCGPEGNKFLFSNENKLVRYWLPASARKILPFTQYCVDDIAKMVRYHLKPETIRQYVPIIDMVAQKHSLLEK